MEFCINTLQSKLREKQQTTKKDDGYSKVIFHLWRLDDTSNIDFNEFSLENVKQAISEFENLPIMHLEDDETLRCDPTNDFVSIYNQLDMMQGFILNKHKKYLPPKEDIFL